MASRAKKGIVNYVTQQIKDVNRKKTNQPIPNKDNKRKVAVVTGSNKGLGLAIVRGLCHQFDGDVIMTARNNQRVDIGMATLKEEGLDCKSLVLDIGNAKQRTRLKNRLISEYGGLDVLVNNAAVMHTEFEKDMPFAAIVHDTITTNYCHTRQLCHELFPLLRKHARVCNMSSLASVNCLRLLHPKLVAKLFRPELTITDLNNFFEDYIFHAEHTISDSGFVMSPLGAYGMSKIGVTIISNLQQLAFDRNDALIRESGGEGMDIVVNACSPGYVTTDMTQGRGQMTVEAGAETPLYLCLLPPYVDRPRGKLVRNKTCYDFWMDDAGEIKVTFHSKPQDNLAAIQTPKKTP